MITIITNIIIIDLLLKFYLITYYLYIYNRIKPLNLFRYKIDSFIWSWFFSFFYISLFIIVIQILRVSNFNRSYNLKLLYFYLKYFYYSINFINIIYLIIFCVIFLVIILLILNKINHFFMNHIYKLFIYYNYKPQALVTERDHYRINILFWLKMLGKIDIVSHYLQHLIHKITFFFEGKDFDFRKLPKYHPYRVSLYLLTTKYHKYYSLFLILSPLYIIIYDCICNNFIVSHVYMFLIFYTPIMLLRKITMILSSRATFVIQTIWIVLYDPKPGIYAISSDIKEILDFYLKDNLGDNHNILLKDGLKSDLDLPLILQKRIYYNIEFIPHNIERNTFVNSEGIYLRMLQDGKVFQELENNDIINDRPDATEEEYLYLGEEWILLADKTKKAVIWNYNYYKVN